MKYNVLCSPGTSLAPIWIERSSCRHIWLLTRGQAHIYVQHTHAYMHAKERTHSQNAPILLHNPNLSESTLCFPLGFPPLLSSQLISFSLQLLLLQHPPLHASLSSLLSSTYPLLHSSACSFSFFQICATTDEPSSGETNSKPNPSVIFKKEKMRRHESEQFSHRWYTILLQL